MSNSVEPAEGLALASLAPQEGEPVVLYTSVGVLISAVAAVVGLSVDPGAVANAILGVVAVAAPLVAALKARSKVTPVA